MCPGQEALIGRISASLAEAVEAASFDFAPINRLSEATVADSIDDEGARQAVIDELDHTMREAATMGQDEVNILGREPAPDIP